MAEPVLVLQFMSDDGPGHLGTWLSREGIVADVRSAAAGEVFPHSIEGFRGLAVLGGAMSANDDLPFLRTAERLILDAMRADVPVLGHCLGGQLMARALGAEVHASPAPEVGWHTLQCEESEEARRWFGNDAAHTVFQWHYEAFDVPAGARRVAYSAACPNQAFSIGRHLAMQFHVEVDSHKIAAWLAAAGSSIDHGDAMRRTIHPPRVIHETSPRYLSTQQSLADRIYGRWLGLLD